MRSAVVLLLLFLLAPARAADDDGEESPGLGRRLRAIDETAEYEAEHPDAGDEEPGDEEEEPDAVPAEHDDGPTTPPAPSRKSAAGTRPEATAPSRPGAATPKLESPLDRPDDPDDDR